MPYLVSSSQCSHPYETENTCTCSRINCYMSTTAPRVRHTEIYPEIAMQQFNQQSQTTRHLCVRMRPLYVNVCIWVSIAVFRAPRESGLFSSGFLVTDVYVCALNVCVQTLIFGGSMYVRLLNLWRTNRCYALHVNEVDMYGRCYEGFLSPCLDLSYGSQPLADSSLCFKSPLILNAWGVTWNRTNYDLNHSPTYTVMSSFCLLTLPDRQVELCLHLLDETVGCWSSPRDKGLQTGQVILFHHRVLGETYHNGRWGRQSGGLDGREASGVIQ